MLLSPQTCARHSVSPPQRGSGGTAQPFPMLARVPWEISVFFIFGEQHFDPPTFRGGDKEHLFPKETVRALGGAEWCPRSLSEVG